MAKLVEKTRPSDEPRDSAAEGGLISRTLVMPQLSKDQIADILEAIAQMLELKGEDVFKVRAYTNAARALETFSGDFTPSWPKSRLGEIPGIGKAIAEKITTLATTGELEYLTKLQAEFPPGLFELFELQGLGPKKIKAVWEKLGVTTIAQLEAASEGRAHRGAAGLWQKDRGQHLATAIAARKKHAGRFRLGDIARGRGADARRPAGASRRSRGSAPAAATGGARRSSGDLDFLVSTKAPADGVRRFSSSTRWSKA